MHIEHVDVENKVDKLRICLYNQLGITGIYSITIIAHRLYVLRFPEPFSSSFPRPKILPTPSSAFYLGPLRPNLPFLYLIRNGFISGT